jgi:hypothetical protein
VVLRRCAPGLRVQDECYVSSMVWTVPDVYILTRVRWWNRGTDELLDCSGSTRTYAGHPKVWRFFISMGDWVLQNTLVLDSPSLPGKWLFR